MRLFFLTLAVTLIIAMLPNYVDYTAEEDIVLENGCVIYCLEYKKSLKAGEILSASDVWNKMLFIRTSSMEQGHAVILFIHDNTTYVFSPGHGTFTIAYFPMYDPYDVARELYPLDEIYLARYAETAMLYQMSGMPDL